MRVHVSNYGIVKEADIEFLSGLNVIRGESGSGKSTVIRGIEGAIFNTSGDSVITQGESVACIEIEYEGHKLKRIRNSKSSFKTTYEIDGDKLLKVGQSPVQKVLDAFGMKEIRASTTTLRPNFLPQFSKPFLIDESPSKIFEFLTVTRNAVNLKDVENSITDDLKELQTQKKIKEETINSLKKIVLTSYQIVSHEKEVCDLCELFDAFNKKEERYLKLELLIKSINEKQTLIDFMNKKIELLDSVLSKINNLNVNYEVLNEYIIKISLLDSIINKVSQLDFIIEHISNIIEKSKCFCFSDDKNNKINLMIERYASIEKIFLNVVQKVNFIEKISDDGKILKKEKQSIDKQINIFYSENIPVVILNTNDELCSSLNVTKSEVLNVLSTKWL